MRCDQCGETGSPVVMRQCSRCRVTLHLWCVLDHHVDHGGDAKHPARDYSHMVPVA